MAVEKTLLERIDLGDEDRRLKADPQRVADSVMDHLRKMLNVRRGSVATRPHYGMPDFNDVAAEAADAPNMLRRVIKDMLTKFEPRLKRVTVAHLPNEDNPLDLRFKISARLVVDGEESPVTFETVVGEGGQIAVQG